LGFRNRARNLSGAANEWPPWNCTRSGTFLHQISCLRLYREPFVAVVKAGHRLARRGAVRIHDLDGEPYLMRTPYEQAAVIAEAFGRSGVPMRAAFRSERDDLILAMASVGLGFALLPAHSAIYPGTVALPLVDPEIARDVARVTSRSQPESPAVGVLVHEVMRMQLRVTSAPAVARAQTERLADLTTR
jgi:DNA-binding transcriptional LysR family regulator